MPSPTFAKNKMNKFLSLIFILTALLMGSCKSKEPVSLADFKDQRTPASQNKEADAGVMLPKFIDKLDAGIRYIAMASDEIPDKADYRKNLMSRFTYRARAIFRSIKDDPSMTENSWFPSGARPEAKFAIAKIIVYGHVIEEGFQSLSNSILFAPLSPKAKLYYSRGKGYLENIQARMPEGLYDDNLYESARVDLIATLAGQIGAAARSGFDPQSRDVVRRVMNRLERLPRINSPGKNAKPYLSLKEIMSSPEWKKAYDLCSNVSPEDDGDIEGSSIAIDRASTIEANIEMIQILFEASKDRKPNNFTSFLSPSERATRLPAEVGQVAKPAKKKPVLAVPSLQVAGLIPGIYDSTKETKEDQYFPGVIKIEKRIITGIKKITAAELSAMSQEPGKVLVLRDSVLYPGLINLHNHTKQNVLPVWGEAKGQFENRFEWRAWGNYELAVSGNMNPWIGFSPVNECAAFRWSELSAMIWGTTYLQGPSTCVDNFAIQRVEDSAAFVSKKQSTQAPTDLILPNEMSFVYNELRPRILQLQDQKVAAAYEQALAEKINEFCDLPQINATTVSNAEGLKILKDKKILTDACKKKALPDQFIRYVYWVHPGIAGKKAYLQLPEDKRTAVIAHLAEGRRTDPYNMKEFELIKLLGLDLPYLNFVHGVGISDADFEHLAKKKMGLIWSPYSNLLLYSETLHISAAYKAGVRIALGSDWVPTGSKSVLEEVKLAREFVRKPLKERPESDRDADLDQIFTDKVLYQMLTENPARMLNRWENKPDDAGIGQIAIGSMGTLIAVRKNDSNPYTNLVAKAFEQDIQAVIVDGQLTYGDTPILRDFGIKELQTLTDEIADLEGLPELLKSPDFPKPNPDASADEMAAHLLKVIDSSNKFDWKKTNNLCGVSKSFDSPKSVSAVVELQNFKDKTGLDLDQFDDIEQVLAVNLMTQNRNRTDPQDGKPQYAVQKFPSLYSCNNPDHQKRLKNFVRAGDAAGAGNVKDEWSENSNQAKRKLMRETQKLGRVPASLNELYSGKK